MVLTTVYPSLGWGWGVNATKGNFMAEPGKCLIQRSRSRRTLEWLGFVAVRQVLGYCGKPAQDEPSDIVDLAHPDSTIVLRASTIAYAW